MNILIKTIVVVALATTTCGNFSPSFSTYFADQPELLAALSREDFDDGSFGGGNHTGGTATSRRPIILVHDMAETASHYLAQRTYFVNNGWSPETVYATTYGIGGITPDLPLLKCEYVKQIRKMILAVSNFTNSRVDVAAYGFGSPIARKAIIGGSCVETNETLGEPLTRDVVSFVSGDGTYSTLCLGVISGNCNNMEVGPRCTTAFMQDINEINGREGEAIWTILLIRSPRNCTTGILHPIPGSQQRQLGFGYIWPSRYYPQVVAAILNQTTTVSQ